MKIQILRRTAAVLFLAALLLSLSLPCFAAEETSATPPPVYDTRYDETAGELSVYMHIVNAERGNLDLLPLIRDAAASKAGIDIDAGPVKVYLSQAAVAAFAASGKGKLIFLIEDLNKEPDRSDSTEESTEMLRYRVLIGDGSIPFPKSSVRIRFRYAADDPTLSSAYRVVDGGEERKLRSAYLDNVLSFYPDALGEFVVREAPEEAGIPKTVYLAVGLAALAVASSAVLTVLVLTGRAKRIYLKHQRKE